MDKTTVITLGNLTRFANNAIEKFVAKEEGKVLSSNDFTNDQKVKLEGLKNYVLPQASAEVAGGIKVGAGLSITEDGILSAIGGGIADAVEWNNVIGKPENLLKIGDVYSKAEVDAKVNAVYKFKGSVDSLNDLPAEGNILGDVYNLIDTGMNVAWDGAKWDYLGIDVDLSGYVQAENLIEATNEQIDALFT